MERNGNANNIDDKCDLNCANGSCDNSNGHPHCVCISGWTGSLVQRITSNFHLGVLCQDQIHTTTEATTTTQPACTLNCQHGYCDNSNGHSHCVCWTGWTGTLT